MAELSSIRNFILRLFIGVILLLIWGESGYAQTVLGFTNDSTKCGSATIGFQATINGSALNLADYTFRWDFGGGGKGTGATTSFLFPVKPGAVGTSDTVILTAVYKDGTLYQIPKIIKVSPAPIPALIDTKNISDPFNNCVNSPTPQKPTDSISVKNNSKDTAFIANYLIEWGDGTTRSLSKNQFSDTINHIYTKLGLFKLKLTTTGDNGCSATKVYDVRNQSNPGIGIISLGGTEGCAPVPFKFKLGGIYNNDPATSYLFDFGDKSTVTWTQADALAKDSTISHTYTRSSCDQPGFAYTVKVTASNSCKSTSATVDGITITSDPAPNFLTSNLCEGKPVQFVNDTHFDCFNKVSYIWNFGDGSATEYTADNSVVTHTFPIDTNQYTVSLTARGSCHDTTIYKVVTLVRKPIADFQLPSGKNCLNEHTPIVITATNQSNSYGQPLAYHWSVIPKTGWQYFRSDSTSVSPQFSFSKKGNYTIFLTVSNSCSSDDIFKSIMINDSVYATLSPISPQCDHYTFDASQTASFKIDSLTQNEKISAQWTITGGGVFIAPTNDKSIAPKIYFSTPGDYKISVALTNGNGCGTIIKSTNLTIKKLTHLIAAASKTVGCASDIVDFSDNSDGSDLTYNWSVTSASGVSKFTTGNASSQNASIQFNKEGVYTVTHRVIGYCSTESKPFTITIYSTPKITLQTINNQCDPSFKLVLNSGNFNTINNGEPLPAYEWSVTPLNSGVTFADGTTFTDNFPHIQFSKTGQYTVSVKATNECGSSPASKTFWILEHAVENASAMTDHDCIPSSVTFTDNSKGNLIVHNWSVSPATGWTISDQSTPSPKIIFNKADIYTVTHKVLNQCDTVQHDYIFKVKDKPTAILAPIANKCGSFTFNADMRNFNVTLNQNDPSEVSYLWTVTPDNGVTFPNSSKNAQYPIINIADTGVFVIKAALTNACGNSEVHESVSITKSPEIALTQNLSSNCLPSDLTFPTGKVYGQNVKYQWSVLPNNGVSFQNFTNASSPRPLIRFTQPGPYEVTLKVSNDCDDAIQHWNDTIIGKPTINLTPIPDTCDNYTLKTEKFVTYQENGNAITGYNWTVTSNTQVVNYIDGTTSTSKYPHIQFSNADTYQLTVEATNACDVSLTAKRSFTIDKFIQVTVGQIDSTFCTGTDLIKLSGNPLGGNWSIQPSSASALVKVIGSATYFDPSVPGIYTLTYHRGNSYCFSEASKNFTVVALPIVDVGRDFSICMNETKPYSLSGTPVGGTWTGSGVTGNTFSPGGLAVGSYILKYSYTNPNTSCFNSDQLVARVLDVPVTGFTAPVQGCSNQPVTFTPFGTANTVFNWDFGDGQTGSSTGPINHNYLKGGLYTVNLISSDPNNCAYATNRKIIIQGDIIMPVVNYIPTNGCGPLTVTFTIDTTGTTGNGQKHQWDFGNGTVINNAITGKVITYNPGLADTSYTVHLTVLNDCFTKTVDYIIPVMSKSNSNFSFPQPWICSLGIVRFKNQTIDRRAAFYWDFDDGTTSTEFEPTHMFTVDKISKYFKVKLVATNGCGKDSITKSILVKPNSLDAFIQMSVLQACPRDTVKFKNLSTDTVQLISSYYWDFGDGTIANTWDATHAYANSGIYTIKLFISNGCSKAETSAQIEILKIPDLQIASLDTICKGDSLKLQGSSNGVVLINGKWDFGDGSFGTGTNVIHAYNTLGWHAITFMAADVTSILKCAGLTTKKVYVKDTPLPLFLPDLAGCSPFSITIPSPGPDSYLWNFGDDNLWNASSQHTYINNGGQPVRKKVTILAENNLLCRTTSFFWVTIYPNPVAKIGVRSEEGYPEVVFFRNLSTNSSTCEWLFPDGSIGYSCDSISFKYYRNGPSRIYLKTTNQYGCTDTTSIVHQTLIKGLFVPNALQPSNADPLVKNFQPIGIGLKTYHLGIYDTWGNLIWETEKLKDTETDEGWNGQTKTGKELPQGVYIWRISATFIDGTSWKGMKTADNKTRTEGTITLIR